jgi:hypothetical protein
MCKFFRKNILLFFVVIWLNCFNFVVGMDQPDQNEFNLTPEKFVKKLEKGLSCTLEKVETKKGVDPEWKNKDLIITQTKNYLCITFFKREKSRALKKLKEQEKSKKSDLVDNYSELIKNKEFLFKNIFINIKNGVYPKNIKVTFTDETKTIVKEVEWIENLNEIEVLELKQAVLYEMAKKYEIYLQPTREFFVAAITSLVYAIIKDKKLVDIEKVEVTFPFYCGSIFGFDNETYEPIDRIFPVITIHPYPISGNIDEKTKVLNQIMEELIDIYKDVSDKKVLCKEHLSCEIKKKYGENVAFPKGFCTPSYSKNINNFIYISGGSYIDKEIYKNFLRNINSKKQLWEEKLPNTIFTACDSKCDLDQQYFINGYEYFYEEDMDDNFQFKTLFEWSEQCFKDCPDLYNLFKPDSYFLVSNKIPYTPLSNKEFTRCLNLYKQKMQSDSYFNQKNLWMNELFFNENYYKLYTYKTSEYEQRIEVENHGYIHPYVMKKEIDTSGEGVELFIMGDIHGGVQSLLRCLWRLVVLGYIDNQFNIVDKKKFYMVFLGDYVDRGSFGAEVVYTLCRLKLANWDNVFLLRGNHEDNIMSKQDGFFEELKTKFYFDNFEILNRWYGFLPMAFFLNGLHIAHGGIGYENEQGTVEYNPTNFLRDKFSSFQKIFVTTVKTDEGQKIFSQGFNWSDIVQGYECVASSRYAGFEVGCCYSKEYLEKHGLKAFVRGHQHHDRGLKIIPKNGQFNNLNDCVFVDNVVLDNKINKIDRTKFNFKKQHFPIFTFTNVSSVKNLCIDHDFFGILHMKNQYEDWEMEVFHKNLKQKWERENRYVKINFDGGLEWLTEQEKKQLQEDNNTNIFISKSLVEKANENTQERIKLEAVNKQQKPVNQQNKQSFTLKGVLKTLQKKLVLLKNGFVGVAKQK